MESFTFFAPTRLLFGPGKLNELGDQELPGKRALLVTTGGKSVKENGYLARVEAQLDRAGVEHVLFDRIEPNPLRDTVNAGGWMARVEHALQIQKKRLPDVGGHIMQGQEGRHFFHVEGLGIQLQSQLVSQIIFLRNAKIPEIGTNQQPASCAGRP